MHLFLGPLQELNDLFERYSSGASSAQRIFLLLDTEPEILDPSQPRVPARCADEVEFRDVSFAYDPRASRPVIRELNLHIPAGQVLAIVGPTGHGKSPLVQLLTRLYEVQSGSVPVDGQDVRDYAQQHLRQAVGIVLPDNVLFSGSVLDNLRLAAPEARDDALIAALPLSLQRLSSHELSGGKVLLRRQQSLLASCCFDSSSGAIQAVFACFHRRNLTISRLWTGMNNASPDLRSPIAVK